jgi:hypothetical protein
MNRQNVFISVNQMNTFYIHRDEHVMPVHEVWLFLGLFLTFGPGWYYKPGPNLAFGPGWYYKPGPKLAFGPGSKFKPGPMMSFPLATVARACLVPPRPQKLASTRL